ncbi:uncharacterized protein A4U43_C01F5620 [Asparagus officinalis]|uniref:Uncharacterized protein n=1 Tax=Asparagus officinalis TaxID=4686 RepID=A0A5P1FM23_ASPOF|nr:uncharacterized protein LOC109849179 [Asparagus officinalis]XP_020274590.1 uncharacterized protein LOC109849179 [Asparagus officinalis]ONK79365.1 uncharacterized protein A4U43_C01F5620 [Asparagus officinalis]
MDDECVEAFYSDSAYGRETDIKEFFYDDKIVTEVELSEMRVCVEDDSRYIVKDIPMDKLVRSSDKILVVEVGNQTLANGLNDSIRKMDLKYTVLDSTDTINQDQADEICVLHYGFNGCKLDLTSSARITEVPADQASFLRLNTYEDSSVSFVNSEEELDTTAPVVSNIPAKCTENPADQDSFFLRDSNKNGSSVSSIDNQDEPDSVESVLDNITTEVTEKSAKTTEVPEVQVSFSHRDSYEDSSVSLTNSEGKLAISASIRRNKSARFIEIPADEDSLFLNDFGGTVGQDNPDLTESVLDNITAEVTENSAAPVSCENSSATPVNSEDKLVLTASMISNMSAKLTENPADQDSFFFNNSDGKSSNSIDKQDDPDLTESVLGSISAEVTKNSAAPVSHEDSSLSSVNSGDKLNITASVLRSNSANFTGNPADQASLFLDDSDGRVYSGSSIDNQDNSDSTESVSGNLSAEVTQSSLAPVSDAHNDCDEKSSVSLSNNRDKLDTAEPVLGNISAEVTESSVARVSDVHSDCEEKDSSMNLSNYWDKFDTVESAVSDTSLEVIKNQLFPSEEKTTESSQADSLDQATNDDQKQSADGQKFEAKSEDTNAASTTLSFPSEISVLSNESKEIPNSKVPSDVITFNFDTESASTSGRNENKESTNCQKTEVVARNSPQIEETKIEGATTSLRYSFLQLMQGESNASEPSILSGSLASSGRIPYSGSISLRSDSSTTSARSFAFPILQSEWNSSPVKMAKADRRGLKKHQGWRMGLLCCRF